MAFEGWRQERDAEAAARAAEREEEARQAARQQAALDELALEAVRELTGSSVPTATVYDGTRGPHDSRMQLTRQALGVAWVLRLGTGIDVSWRYLLPDGRLVSGTREVFTAPSLFGSGWRPKGNDWVCLDTRPGYAGPVNLYEFREGVLRALKATHD